MRWVIHRLDSGPRKLLGRSPSAAPAQLRTGVGVQCRPSWAAVVWWIGGHLGGHSLAKYRAPTGWLHWAGRPGRLPTSVGTVTARSPWLLSTAVWKFVGGDHAAQVCWWGSSSRRRSRSRSALV